MIIGQMGVHVTDCVLHNLTSSPISFHVVETSKFINKVMMSVTGYRGCETNTV
jgi:hypothetical protein